MYIQKKSIPMIIILSLVTCGIYYLFWLYQTTTEVNNTVGDTSESAGMELVLILVTCGIYSLYWYYKYCKKLVRLCEQVGAPQTDNSLVCLILAVFGFSIVSGAIMQSQINMLADGMVRP
ncbi:MAG: DUF4234 domain-containing protein [Anaerotruncus sp.]|nr:DUF4234 domain-containing protein [Anaerotruncus sp.]